MKWTIMIRGERPQWRLSGRGVWGALGFLVTFSIAGAQSYTAVDLGSFGGSDGSRAFAINNSGVVVGDSWLPGNSAFHAFRYGNGVMTDLGTLGGANSAAYAINDAGMIVGYSTTPGEAASVAFAYSNGTMTNLGTLGGANSYATGINSSGTIVGYSYLSSTTAEGLPQGAFMLSNGTMTYLGHLAGGANSQAYGINDAGTVVGMADISITSQGFGTDHAFSFANGTMTDLGTLGIPASGGPESAAYAINHSGMTVGSSGGMPFVYRGGSMRSLGNMGPQQTDYNAVAINSSGTIVGDSFGSFSFLAFVDIGGELINLNSVVSLAGVTLQHAVGINDGGQIIALGNNFHSYLLTPTPGTTLGNNTADGYQALLAVSSGRSNTAVGSGALITISTSSSNTSVGAEALAAAFSRTPVNYNTAAGVYSLSADETGSFGTAIGAQALFGNLTGAQNVALGYSALFYNSSGSRNTAIGSGALEGFVGSSIETGTSNDADGYGALNSITSGTSNSAHGALALYSDRGGSSNVAFGSDALSQNISGSFNTALGAGALEGNIAGGNNTVVGVDALGVGLRGNSVAFGDGALGGLSAGGNDIAIGYNAGSQLTTGSSNIMIGNVGDAADNATIRIGTQGTQLSTYIAGIYANGVTGSPVVVNGSGQLGVAPSSERFKEDIRDMDASSEAILALRPVTFHYRPEIDPAGTSQFGLVAEEVAKISPDLVTRDAKGHIFTVRYDAVNAMLLNEFRKQHDDEVSQSLTILQLQNRIAALASQDWDIAELAARLDVLEKARAKK